MARTMEQMEQLLGHALLRVEDVEKLHDRHEAETKSLMHELRAEARVATQLIQALQAQVVQLTSRVSTLDEALLAERRRNEQLSARLEAQVPPPTAAELGFPGWPRNLDTHRRQPSPAPSRGA